MHCSNYKKHLENEQAQKNARDKSKPTLFVDVSSPLTETDASALVSTSTLTVAKKPSRARVGARKLPQTSSMSVARAPSKSTSRLVQSKINAVPTMSTTEYQHFQKLLVEWIIDNHLAFSIVEKDSTRRFFEAIRPMCSNHLPSRKTLTEKWLPMRSQEALESVQSLIRKELGKGKHPGMGGRMSPRYTSKESSSRWGSLLFRQANFFQF